MVPVSGGFAPALGGDDRDTSGETDPERPE